MVSIFSCAVLDHDLSSFISNSRDPGLELKNLKGTALVANAAAGYWSQDTAYVCMAGTHKWLFGLGVVWTVLFCVGFPAAMAAVLYKNRNDLEETKARGVGGFLKPLVGGFEAARGRFCNRMCVQRGQVSRRPRSAREAKGRPAPGLPARAAAPPSAHLRGEHER